MIIIYHDLQNKITHILIEIALMKVLLMLNNNIFTNWVTEEEITKKTEKPTEYDTDDMQKNFQSVDSPDTLEIHDCRDPHKKF